VDGHYRQSTWADGQRRRIVSNDGRKHVPPEGRSQQESDLELIWGYNFTPDGRQVDGIAEGVLMKRMVLTALPLALLILGCWPRQGALSAPSELGPRTRLAGDLPDAQEIPDALVGCTIDQSRSDDENIRLSPDCFGWTPWENPAARVGVRFSGDTAEGQLYLACLYVDSIRIAMSGNDFPDVGERVVSHCRNALSLRPQYTEAYIVMADGFSLMGHYEEAAAALHSAIGIHPECASLFCALTRVNVALERYTEALASSRQEILLRSNTSSNSPIEYEGTLVGHSVDGDRWRVAKIC
jgi:hypothetical protein